MFLTSLVGRVFIKTLWILGLILVFHSGLWAADAAPQKINRPYFLRVKDKTPNESLTAPTGSVEDANGQSLATDENIYPPDAATMDRLSDPVLFETIRKTKSAETDVNRFYWHAAGDLDYCHYQDEEGNHWYGWSDDGGFNWILSRGHRYWWHDPFGKHWLYYYQGYWWRADGQKKNSIQVCMDGEYYACDGQGHVVTDMGGDGNGNIMSAPGRYRGDFHHGGHGDGGGHGAEGQPSSGAPQGAAPSGAQPGN